MDEIQKELIKAGRKDLAQEYYLKIAADPKSNMRRILSDIKQLIGKLEIVGDKSIVETLTDKLRMKLNEYDFVALKMAGRKLRKTAAPDVKKILDNLIQETSCEIVLDSLSDVLWTIINHDNADDKEKQRDYSMIKQHVDIAKNFAQTHSL